MDISEKALSLARENAQNNGADVEFIESDLFENVNKKFDVILSNPPYIPTKDIEKLEKDPSKSMFAGYLNSQVTKVIDPAILNGTNYFTYLQVFALILAGDVMVFEICQPFNKYRFSVFLFTAVTSLSWVLISITIGFAPFGIPPIKPLSDYWLLIVVLTVIVILNFFVSQLIHLVFNKLYESKKLKESFEKLKYKK